MHELLPVHPLIKLMHVTNSTSLSCSFISRLSAPVAGVSASGAAPPGPMFMLNTHYFMTETYLNVVNRKLN